MSSPAPASAPLVFVDTETDGTHPDRKIWEIAIIRREPDTDRGPGRETTWQSFVEIDLGAADPFGLRVGRFHERHPYGRYLSGRATERPEADDDDATTHVLHPNGSELWDGYLSGISAAEEIARLTHGAHWIGMVPGFDAEAVAALLRFQGLTPTWDYHLTDVRPLAAGYILGRGGDASTAMPTAELSSLCGVPEAAEDERHTALGDARWTMRLYDAITSGRAAGLPS
ncbi:hypothetical protein [Pseudonocardia sp. WMMC193]|uniref:hypothetical protein n=1 Tax=Pseudonocardia sp. WMMC193 TaxID=2911965 RepID=UPI001F1FA244|nr:hypothetical protein [Pseudonocardia sp. WMMC193]MCF7551007.1 hypothetical protein [Pseudonocardia sp. WMMC193]